MRTATDDNEQRALDDVRKYGVHIIHVTQEDQSPRFSYSIGLFENYAHPEIIIIGLKPELSQVLLNNMAHDIKNGKTLSTGEFHEDVLDNFLCYFGKVPSLHYAEYVGWAIWFYEGEQFPLIQCVYPTVFGKFPWEKDFPDDTRWLCPMLTDPPKEH